MADSPSKRKATGLDKLGASFLAPPQRPDEIGRLERYRVLKVLGKGGMGVVFKAEDPSLQRTVALKVMLPEVAEKATAKERFLREARVAAKIEHDHIIRIFQVGEDRGVPFIAMSYLKGMSLDDWLKQRRSLTVSQILRIGREVAKGLQAAHEGGLIHRDIKPGNIWLDAASNGRVKILDFGLARPEKEDINLTRSGQIIGTPAYMSPEQAAGKKLDPRSDLFSLGVVLYRLCTGKLPFRGDNLMAIVTALALEDPVPVNQINPDVPEGAAGVIWRLLREPAERPAHAREVVEAIAAVEREMQLIRMGHRGGALSGSHAEPIAVPTQTDPSLPAVPTPPSQETYTEPAASAATVSNHPFDFAESSGDLLSSKDVTSSRSGVSQPLRKWAWALALGGLAVLFLAGVTLFVVLLQQRH